MRVKRNGHPKINDRQRRRTEFPEITATVLLLSVAFTVHAKTAGEVYEQAARSTAVVENIDAKGKAQGMGSGVILPDGDPTRAIEMITLIRFCAGLSASILSTLLLVALVGSVEHRKAVGVVTLLIIFVGLAVFYSYLKCDLKTAAQRMIGLVGVLVFAIALVTAHVSAGDIFRAGQDMIGRRWHKEWAFWSALIAANLLPYLAFNFQTVVLPIVKWIAARDPVVLENQQKNKTDEMEVKHLESAEQRHASEPGQAGMEVHSFNHQEGDVAPSESSDEALWVAAMSEVDSESRRAGLWAKSFGESHGVEAAAKANYMVTRVAEMKSEIQSALRTAQQLRHQQLTESRIAQMNEEQKAYERLPKGKCPACEQIIPLTSKECPKCQASFGEGATWRVKPLV